MKRITHIIIGMAAGVAVMLTAGCRSAVRVAESVSVKSDTIMSVSRATDTLWIRDSVVKILNPDSSLKIIERDRMVYRTRTVRDTVYRAHTDTMKREVKVSTTDRTRPNGGKWVYYIMCIVAGAGGGGWLAVKFLRR